MRRMAHQPESSAASITNHLRHVASCRNRPAHRGSTRYFPEACDIGNHVKPLHSLHPDNEPTVIEMICVNNINNACRVRRALLSVSTIVATSFSRSQALLRARLRRPESARRRMRHWRQTRTINSSPTDFEQCAPCYRRQVLRRSMQITSARPHSLTRRKVK